MRDDVYSYDERNGFVLVVEIVGNYEETAYVGYVYYKNNLKYRTPLRWNGERCRQEIIDGLEAYLENFGAVSIDK